MADDNRQRISVPIGCRFNKEHALGGLTGKLARSSDARVEVPVHSGVYSSHPSHSRYRVSIAHSRYRVSIAPRVRLIRAAMGVRRAAGGRTPCGRIITTILLLLLLL
eukprot:1703340-Pyramimonas_sp.AAC.1